MKTYFVFIILLSINISFAQELEYKSTFSFSKNNTIELALINNSKETQYIQISYWEVDGVSTVKEKLTGIIVFPEEYAVNQIIFFSEKMKNKKIPSFKGEKREYPLYKNLPVFIRIKPKDSLLIDFEFPKEMAKIFNNKRFLFKGSLAYMGESNFESYISHFNITKEKVLYNNMAKNVKLQIQNEKHPIELIKSDILIDDFKRDSESAFIRELINKRFDFIIK